MPPVSRRAFLAMLGTVAAGCASGGEDRAGTVAPTGRTTPPPTSAPTTSSTTIPVPVLPGPPFTLGVASGDPLADSVILWTRLAPDPGAGGGMPELLVPVRWEVAADDGFVEVVASGVAIADGEHAHSVHVDVGGLEPATTYWYRFHVGEHTSAVGRTRTLPGPDVRPEHVRFAVASCQSIQDGWFAAHGHLAAEALDAVVWLGDYVYEDGGRPAAVRSHRGGEARTLEDYRDRYAQYKADPQLQAAHAAHPWLVVWDDHEVANNVAGDSLPSGEPPAAVRDRRTAAYRAWWEHQPVRAAAPDGPALEIYRRFAWGDLVELLLLDTRQHRSPQPCAPDLFGAAEACGDALDPEATMLGDDQRGWLLEHLRESTATWGLVGQQVLLAPMHDTAFANTDQWDGYRVERAKVLDAMAERRAAGRSTVVLTGDLHAFGVADLRADQDDRTSPVVATEVLSGSITSQVGGTFRSTLEQAAAETGAIRDLDVERHGYVVLDVASDRVLVARRTADTSSPDAPVTSGAALVLDR